MESFAEFRQSLLLKLPNAFPCDTESLANLLKGLRWSTIEPESIHDDRTFAFGDLIERSVDVFREDSSHRFLVCVCRERQPRVIRVHDVNRRGLAEKALELNDLVHVDVETVSENRRWQI